MNTKTLIDINFLQRAIEEDRYKLQLKEQTLNLLKQLDKLEHGDNNDVTTSVTEPVPSPQDDNSVLIGKAYNYNFTETVRKIIQGFDGEEFTVAKIEAILTREAHNNVPKNPRSRIAMVLKNFIGKDFVVCVSKGFGSTPYIYKQSTKSNHKIRPAMAHNNYTVHHRSL